MKSGFIAILIVVTTLVFTLGPLGIIIANDSSVSKGVSVPIGTPNENPPEVPSEPKYPLDDSGSAVYDVADLLKVSVKNLETNSATKTIGERSSGSMTWEGTANGKVTRAYITRPYSSSGGDKSPLTYCVASEDHELVNAVRNRLCKEIFTSDFAAAPSNSGLEILNRENTSLLPANALNNCIADGFTDQKNGFKVFSISQQGGGGFYRIWWIGSC